MALEAPYSSCPKGARGVLSTSLLMFYDGDGVQEQTFEACRSPRGGGGGRERGF